MDPRFLDAFSGASVLGDAEQGIVVAFVKTGLTVTALSFVRLRLRHKFSYGDRKPSYGYRPAQSASYGYPRSVRPTILKNLP